MRRYIYAMLFAACSMFASTGAKADVDSGIAALMNEGWTIKTELSPTGGIVVAEAVFLDDSLPSAASMKIIKKLNSVKKLTCQVNDNLLKEIAMLPTIQCLELYASNRTDGAPEKRFFIDSLNLLSQNKQLAELSLNGGFVSKDAFLDSEAFAKFASLKKLSLDRISLRTKDLEAIAVLPALGNAGIGSQFCGHRPRIIFSQPKYSKFNPTFHGFLCGNARYKDFCRVRQ